MNTKWFTNPFFVYFLSFLLVFGVYSLGWSVNYPTLSLQLMFFLLSTSIISFFFAFIHEKAKMNCYQPVSKSRYSLYVICAIYVGYLLEFAYSGGVPLINSLRDANYSYKDFKGIPTFHVILGTFNSFYSIYLFHQYSSASKERFRILFFIISIIPIVLVINRGAVIIVLIASFFIYLMKIRKLRLKIFLLIPIGIIGVIYLFGVVGNIRYSASKEDKQFILRIGGASDEFIEGSIPPEYYWGYLYIATPIGNLQNIMNASGLGFKRENVPLFLTTELLPDFISKRAVTIFGQAEIAEKDEASKYLVVEALNAPTVYFRSYYLLGWLGAWAMYLFSVFVMLIYPFLISKRSKYYITGWAILVTIVLLNIFSNMWYASGTVLIWPVLLTYLNKIRIFKSNETNN